MPRQFRFVVVGCGGIGSAAAYWLARECGGDVLVLEQFRLGHDQGASEDHSRIIRHAYHSRVYTALTHAAYDAFGIVEKASGMQLVHKTGGLELAIRDSEGEVELRGYAESMDGRGIDYDLLDGRDVRERYPQFRVDDDIIGLYQADAGIIDIRRSVATHVALARAAGAEVRGDAAVRDIVARADGVEVATDDEAFLADRVIVCAGAWTRRLLSSSLGVDLPITLSQEQVTYFATPNLRELTPDRFPIWIWHGDPLFYGFPVYGEVATKAAMDLGGPFVELEAREWPPDEDRVKAVEEFLAERIPAALGPRLYTRTCLYDMPPDRDFLLDRLPGEERVLVCVGAGHGAKFAGLLGRILAELAQRGETAHPIEAFRADRPAMTDPSFPRQFRLTVPVATT
jgi:monomeric sarcosine oxidase